jgi:predicted transcriptional regulator
MSQSERQYSPTAQQVLAFLQGRPGEYFTSDDICEQTDLSTSQAQVALETLANDGVIDKEQLASGRSEYAYRQR